MQSLNVEERHVRYAEAGVGQRPDKILGVFSGPGPVPLLIDPSDRAERIAGRNDPLELGIREGDLVRDPVGPKRRFEIAADRILRESFAIHAEAEEASKRSEALALGAHAEL